MSEICPKCNKRVYKAEWVLGLGKYYHQFCMTCTTCNKALKTPEVNENDGKIYCKTCYSRNFGPVGFGAGKSSYPDQKSVQD